MGLQTNLATERVWSCFLMSCTGVKKSFLFSFVLFFFTLPFVIALITLLKPELIQQQDHSLSTVAIQFTSQQMLLSKWLSLSSFQFSKCYCPLPTSSISRKLHDVTISLIVSSNATPPCVSLFSPSPTTTISIWVPTTAYLLFQADN